MFGFLKEKLKKTIGIFSKKVEEEVKEEKPVEEVKKEIIKEIKPVEKKEEAKVEEKKKEEVIKKEIKEKEQPKEENKEIKQEIKKEIEKKEVTPEVKVEVEKEEEKNEIKQEKEKKKEEIKEKELPKEVKKEIIKEEIREEPKEKLGFFERIVSKKIDSEKFEELFNDLEIALLENNVSVKVIDKIKENLKKDLVDVPLKRSKIEEIIQESLKNTISQVLNAEKIDLDKAMKEKKPLVICFLGINGSGKTTTIAKFADRLIKKGKTVVLAAADTFRAAAIDQLQEHADRLNVKLIRHDYGSDPAAVAFDAIKHAKTKNVDAVLIDTAGRLHSNVNLLEEMKKIMRVAKPDLKIFVGESITGNDCVEQAEKFNDAVGIDGIILSKADIDEKGGAAISVSYVTGKPIMFIGVGQNYGDLKEFRKEDVISSLGL